VANNILILGAGGVFGNLNAKYILENSNDNIYAVGRNPRLGSEFSLNVGRGYKNFEYHQIHMVFEIEKLKTFIKEKKINIIINYAALAYANSWFGSQHYFRTNTFFVSEIVDFLSSIDHFDYFLQIGTSEVYGSNQQPAKEEVIAPTSPYSISKLAADLFLQSMNDVRGFPCSIIRPSNCFGEGQYTYRIIPKAMLCFLDNSKFPLEGGGVAIKSFMHAENLYSAVKLIIDQKPKGQIYNCGPDEAISMADLVREICVVMNKNYEDHIEVTKGRMFEDSVYRLDSGKLKKELGWHPTVGLREGLFRMYEWINSNSDRLSMAQGDFELRA
tara:strand:- start:1149 stop:2135 length:987 start_codon:yes stop_codon:yes gene_type:complete